jgi:MipA family protein
MSELVHDAGPTSTDPYRRGATSVRPGAAPSFRVLRAAAALLLAALSLTSPPAVQAQSAREESLWEIGLAGVTASQQAYPGASQQTTRTLVLPFGIYRGKYFRADRDNLGVRTFVTPALEFDLGFGAALGSDSSDIDARRGMPDLGDLIEAGPRLRWHIGTDDKGGRLRADFPLRAVLDLSDRLAYQGLSFEPKLTYERHPGSRWRYATSAGAIFGDARFAGVLYGVDPAYATPERPAYEAQAGLIAWRLSTNATFDLTREIRVFGYVRVDTVAGAANVDSPLVRERTGVSGGVGISYTFRSSQKVAFD